MLALSYFISAFISHARATGILEHISETSFYAHSVFTGEMCTSFDSAKAVQNLQSRDAQCNSLPAPTLSGTNLQSALDLYRNVNDRAEAQFFGALARAETKELHCSSTYAKDLSGGKEDGEIARIAESLKQMRELKKSIVARTQDLMRGAGQKVCPSSLDDLAPTNAALLQGQPDSYFENCDSIIKARVAFTQIENSIPFAELPSLAELTNNVANDFTTGDVDDASLSARVKTAYGSISDDLKSSAEKLAGIQPSDLNRKTKYELCSDPMLVRKVIQQAGGGADVKGLACKLDAQYHSGADTLSTDIFVGGLVLGGVEGLAVKGGLAALRALKIADIARSAGIVSVNGSRAIRAVALLGKSSAKVLANYPAMIKACAEATPMALQAKAPAGGDECLSRPSVAQIQNDSCVLQGALLAFGLKDSAKALAQGAAASLARQAAAAKDSEIVAKVATKVSPLMQKLKSSTALSRPNFGGYDQAFLSHVGEHVLPGDGLEKRVAELAADRSKVIARYLDEKVALDAVGKKSLAQSLRLKLGKTIVDDQGEIESAKIEAALEACVNNADKKMRCPDYFNDVVCGQLFANAPKENFGKCKTSGAAAYATTGVDGRLTFSQGETSITAREVSTQIDAKANQLSKSVANKLKLNQVKSVLVSDQRYAWLKQNPDFVGGRALKDTSYWSEENLGRFLTKVQDKSGKFRLQGKTLKLLETEDLGEFKDASLVNEATGARGSRKSMLIDDGENQVRVVICTREPCPNGVKEGQLLTVYPECGSQVQTLLSVTKNMDSLDALSDAAKNVRPKACPAAP